MVRSRPQRGKGGLSADLSTVRVYSREVDGQMLSFTLTEDDELRDQETASL
ncbi:MAG: hypothetical protein VYC64_06510 [Candidatus Latescibacterota bacterium]|nr:hypothetical protein [Candidatus Latescibacterota bacterium]